MNGLDNDVAGVMARNEEILECKRQIQFWTERLAQLEAARRREALLPSFDIDPRGTWSKLTPEEKQDKDWVIKGISNGVYRNDTWLSQSHGYGGEDLPEQFRGDRDVVLAYVAQDKFAAYFENRTFHVPESLRDDKEVMLAICAKNSKALQHASPRLQDDRDVVLAALGGDKHYDQCQLEHASNRLRSDKDFILNQVKCTPFNWTWDYNIEFRWLEFAKLGLEDEKEVALAALKRTSELKSSGHTCYSSGLVEYFSPALRDDRDIMLRFVKDHWFNLSSCSNRLKSFEEFVNTAVSQNVNALEYCFEATKEELFSKRDQNDVLQELENGDLWLESLPKEMKNDPRVLLAALKGDSIRFKDLPDDLRRKKEFILSGIPEEPEEGFYDALPEHLQEDEEVCLELLKKRYCWWEAIFEKVPSLYHSREAVQAVIYTACTIEDMYVGLPDFLQQCPFRDDEEAMLLACETDSECLKYASERLRSDRGFIQSLLSRSYNNACIVFASHDFQVNNTDIVLESIEQCDVNDSLGDWIEHYLAPDLWQDRSIVMACLKKGWSILRKLDRESPLLDDAELVRLALEKCTGSLSERELEYASSSLKTDRDFALSVVKINGLSLTYLDAAFKRDDEIVTEAIANTDNTILNCFCSEDDFGYLVSFSARVRSRLELHKSFVNDFLRGISVSRPHVAPAKRCRLPILDRGPETSTAFKKLIAEYLGVPVKKELRLLRAASENLRKLRY